MTHPQADPLHPCLQGLTSMRCPVSSEVFQTSGFSRATLSTVRGDRTVTEFQPVTAATAILEMDTRLMEPSLTENPMQVKYRSSSSSFQDIKLTTLITYYFWKKTYSKLKSWNNNDLLLVKLFCCYIIIWLLNLIPEKTTPSIWYNHPTFNTFNIVIIYFLLAKTLFRHRVGLGRLRKDDWGSPPNSFFSVKQLMLFQLNDGTFFCKIIIKIKLIQINSGPAIGGEFEAASRPAFEMIESVVYTVGSVSQLLDSSYNAILASFRFISIDWEKMLTNLTTFNKLTTSFWLLVFENFSLNF